MLKNMRVVAESLLDGSDTTMSPDEVNEALDAANELLAELSPVIHQQIENAQQQIDDAASAVQVCHAQSVAELRSSLRESAGQHAAAVESCHNTLDQLRTAETRQCNIAEDCLCDEARVRTTDQEPLCAAITEIYEVAFCEHHHVCTIFHQCHSQEAQVFQHLRADVEAEIALTVQEYIAVEQSRCLTGLIMEAMTSRTPISHAALIACDDVDVSALNINFPDLPSEPAACPAHTHGDPQCEGSWVLLAHQTMADGLFPASVMNTFMENSDDPSASLYMNIGGDHSHYLVDGKYHLRLVYTDVVDAHRPCNAGPALSGTYEAEWFQSSWITEPVVTDFETISPADLSTSTGEAGCQFSGLALSSNAATAFDGSHDHTYWFGSVGVVSSWSGGFPAFKGGVAQGMSLYVKA